MEKKIFAILQKHSGLTIEYDFTQDAEDKCLINLASNSAIAKEIAALIEPYKKLIDEQEKLINHYKYLTDYDNWIPTFSEREAHLNNMVKIEQLKDQLK